MACGFRFQTSGYRSQPPGPGPGTPRRRGRFSRSLGGPPADADSGKEVSAQLVPVGDATRALQLSEERAGGLGDAHAEGKGDHELVFFAELPPVGYALGAACKLLGLSLEAARALLPLGAANLVFNYSQVIAAEDVLS